MCQCIENNEIRKHLNVSVICARDAGDVSRLAFGCFLLDGGRGGGEVLAGNWCRWGKCNGGILSTLAEKKGTHTEGAL